MEETVDSVNLTAVQDRAFLLQKAMTDDAADKTITYHTRGTCSEALKVTIRGGLIAEASFEGGCQGNLEGLARLVVGLSPAEAVSRLRGIRCGDKDTSCPDQLARALETGAPD